MNISAGKKIRTGLFVVTSLLLLLVLIVIIGKHKNLFGNTFTVYARFKNIAGTKEGNFVRFAGINIGTVEGVTIINDTTVQLELKIEKKIQPYIKTDAIASIGGDGLMGDKLVMIAPGSDSSVVVKNGGMLQATNPVNMDRIMTNLAMVSENAAVVTGGLASIVTNINQGKGTIGRLLGDDKMADRLENTIATARQTASSITKTANSVNANMEAAKSNFLLKGYFKKKERQRIKDSTEKANKLLLPEKKKKG